MKKTLLILLMMVLAISCVLTSCNNDSGEDKTLESISVDTSSIKTEYNVNEITDFSGIKVTAKYSDGSSETIAADKLEVGDVDTSSAGVKELIVTYKGITVKVNVTVVEQSKETAVIKGVSLPSSVTSVEAARENFRNKTQKYYVVGDDNPYVLNLILEVYDRDTNAPITTYTDYVGVSKVYLVEGETVTLLEGNDIATYVAIDEEKHTYDFTNAAVGKVFKIETRPSKDFDNESKVTESLTVQVVDGYNIYDAKELNFLTNNVEFEIGRDNEYYQVKVVDAFLAKHGLTRPENLAGIVLHKDFVIELTDLPQEYVIPDTAGDASGYIYDDLMVYNHIVTRENPVFNFYGNYHTVDSNKIPRVPALDASYNKDGISNAALFFFTIDSTITDSCKFDGNGEVYANAPHTDPFAYRTYDPADYVTNIYDLALRDNEPTSNNGSDEFLQAAKRGLIGLKTKLHTVNLENSRVEAFMLSVLIDGDHQEVNLKEVILNNAWQNHIFAWSKNILWERNYASDAAPAEDHHKLVVNVENSSITKCGGPIIISQTADLDEASNAKSANVINIDDKTVISTYISTADAWFHAYPTAAMYAEMIVAANDVIAMMSQGTAGFVDATMYEGSDIMNIVMIDMVAGSDLDLTSGADLNSILTVDGKALLNQEELPQAAAMLVATTQGKLPIFVTSDGGVFGINPQATTPDEAIVTLAGVTPECLSGDYITLYWMGMAITFEYFHFTPAA